MSYIDLFGLLAVSLMLLFYALERRGRLFILLFAGACMLGSAYGFLQGASPFGLVEGVWAGVAAWRWWRFPSPARREKVAAEPTDEGSTGS